MASKNTAPVATPQMLNAIRAEASSDYQARVPEANERNLVDVGNPILEYTAMANEFLEALVNKIVSTLVERQRFDNPLSPMRRGPMPLGFDLEEVQSNPAQAERYTGTEADMSDILKMHKPDTESCYHRLNRQDRYVVTINNDQLRGAFLSWNKMEDFIASLVDTLYNGNAIDEYKYTKQLISQAVTGGKMNTVQVANPVDYESGKRFLSKLRGLSAAFTFPSTNYNNYTLMGGTGNPRMTFSPIDRQIIIIDAQVAATVGVDVLASVFNLDYANYVARQVMVDSFGDNGKTLAVLADERTFIIMEQLRQFTTFYNAATLGWQYYYHAWDMFSMSPFYNAVALQQQP